MTAPETTASRLAAHGLRVTPQRRALLDVFVGGAAEHLSADEVGERARLAVPELGRATVYNTLAEFLRAGLLVSFGTDEPVRYELAGPPHHHFRCRACGRLLDVELADAPALAPAQDGFRVDRADVLLTGDCDACTALEGRLRDGIRRVAAPPSEPPPDLRVREPVGAAVAEVDSPLGTLLVAVADGQLVRLAFPEHAAPARAQLERRFAGVARDPARTDPVARQLDGWFAGRRTRFSLRVRLDLLEVPAGRALLRAVSGIEAGGVRHPGWFFARGSAAARETGEALGLALGANPVPVVVPCHRVVRADGRLGGYVGGSERKRALLRHERAATGRDAAR